MQETQYRAYEPIEPQPRTALFEAHPEIEVKKAKWQEAQKDVQRRPGAMARLKEAEERESRQFAAAMEEIESQFVLTPETRIRYIQKGIQDPAEIEHAFCGPELDPKQKKDAAAKEKILEALNGKEHALRILRQDAAAGTRLTQAWIRGMHGLLTRHQPWVRTSQPGIMNPLRSGEFKKRRNLVRLPDGTVQWYADPYLVEPELARLLEMHEENQVRGVPAEAEAAWMMRQIKHIHPFQDGNSRTSRMVMNLLLLQGGFPLLTLYPETGVSTLEYALYRAMQQKDWEPLLTHIREQLGHALSFQTRQIRRAIAGKPLWRPVHGTETLNEPEPQQGDPA